MPPPSRDHCGGARGSRRRPSWRGGSRDRGSSPCSYPECEIPPDDKHVSDQENPDGERVSGHRCRLLVVSPLQPDCSTCADWIWIGCFASPEESPELILSRMRKRS